MNKKIKQIIMISIFVLVIFGLTITNILMPSREFSETENRPLEQLPEFSFKDLFDGKYTVNFEKYTTDQFIGRDNWVQLKNDVDYTMQKKDSNNVYFGKDGYLFEKLTENKLNKQQLKTNFDRTNKFLEKYQEKLGKDHIKVMIVPNSFEILSEKLPKYAPVVNQSKYLSDMQKTMGDSFINLVDVFNNSKNSVDLYYKTDHHWTTDGAFVAYQEWCKSMGLEPIPKDKFDISVISDEFYGTYYSKARYAGIKPDDIKKYVPKDNYTYKLDYDLGSKKSDTLYSDKFLSKKDKYSYFLDSNHAVVDIKTNVNNNRKLLVIKDSYANSFVPFAVNHFSEVYVVDFRYYRQGMSKFIEENGITDALVMYNFSSFSTDTNTGAMIL